MPSARSVANARSRGSETRPARRLGRSRFEYAPSSATRRIDLQGHRARGGLIPGARPARTSRPAPTPPRSCVDARRAPPRRARAPPSAVPTKTPRSSTAPIAPGSRTSPSRRPRPSWVTPAASTLRGWPRNVVVAPGSGARARTRRTTAAAGSQSRPRSSAPGSSAPWSPPPVLGSLRQAPRLQPAQRPHEQRAPSAASRAPSVPASSSARIASSGWRRTGPVSMPSSIRIVVTPCAHPRPGARACTGAAPRQRGQQREVEVDRRRAGQVAASRAARARRRRPPPGPRAPTRQARGPSPSLTRSTSASGSPTRAGRLGHGGRAWAATPGPPVGRVRAHEDDVERGVARDRFQRRDRPRVVPAGTRRASVMPGSDGRARPGRARSVGSRP